MIDINLTSIQHESFGSMSIRGSSLSGIVNQIWKNTTNNYLVQWVFAYSCVVSLRTGYGGVNCELEIDECLYDPPICLNGGECRNYEGSFGCLCLNFNGQYITGPFCEKVKEYCDIEEDPPACKNGGTCTSGTYNYECTCAPGFSGKVQG